MSSYRFEMIVFVSTREEQFIPKRMILMKAVNLMDCGTRWTCASHGNPKHFFYISSTEVYGNMEDRSENIEPVPASINGHTLLTGENYCKFYQHEFGLNVTILRVSLYLWAGRKGGFSLQV